MPVSKLLNRASTGEQEAFRELYDRYRPMVYSYALQITRCAELAEDIVHDVFLKLWGSGVEADNELGFIRIVTRNHTLSILRKQLVEHRSVSDAARQRSNCESCTDETIAYHETRSIVSEAISQLSPQRKEVFLLCREEGLKYNEVAKRMNLSPLTVKTHMQLALRFLRSYVTKYSGILILGVLARILTL